MKILLVLVLLLSFGASAQCFVPLDSGAVRICSTDPGMGQYGPNTCSTSQPWLDITGMLLPTQNTIDTCMGYWISPAADIRNYQTVEVTPENFALAFGFGVSAVLTFWFLPYVGSVAGNVIRRM